MWLKSWMSCCSGWWELLQGWRWTGPWIRSWAASSSTTFTSGSVSRSTKLFLSVRSDHKNTAASLPRGFRFIYVLSPSRLHPPHVSLHRGDLVVRRPVSLPGSDLCPLAALWHGRLTHLPHLLLLRLRSQVRPQQLPTNLWSVFSLLWIKHPDDMLKKRSMVVIIAGLVRFWFKKYFFCKVTACPQSGC